MAKTTSDLLTNVKRRTQLPDDGGTLSDSDILAFATDELQNVVMPRLMAMNEWHYAFSYTETLTSVREYRINSRCAGNRIISVELLDGTEYRFIRLTHPLTQDRDNGECYSIYGNKIVLSDAIPDTGTIRIRAVLRPSSLSTSGTNLISASDLGATIRLSVGSSSGIVADNEVDIIFHTSPYEVHLMNLVVTAVGAGTIDVTSALDATLANFPTGARVCLSETTDRVPLPDELHDYLAQRVAVRCMEARGMTADMQNHLRKLADLESAFDRLVSPRNKGEFKAIVNEDFSIFRRY